MRIDEVLRPELILCRPASAQSQPILQELGERIRATGAAIPAQEILDTLGKRRHAEPLPMGKGMVVYHLRTEKVSELTVALAVCPWGISDLPAPDGIPVRVITLFLTPKKHSERYLAALAAIVEALSSPETLDRVVAAERPEDVIAVFSPEEILESLDTAAGMDAKVLQMLSRMTPRELADLLDDASPKVRGHCLTALPPPRAAEVTRHMGLSSLGATLRRIPPDAAAKILSFVPSSRCADVLQRMPHEEQDPILKHLSNASRVQVLLTHPPHTAGGIMTPEVLSVGDTATVGEALKRVGEFKDRRQTSVYVTNGGGRLIGWCQFHALAAADPAGPVTAAMRPDPPTSGPEKDQEELFHILAKDDAQAIAVLAADGSLLGVVTEDALLGAMEHEANEDLEQIVGSKVIDPLHTPMGMRMRMRLPWLVLTLAGELLIALVIVKVFQATLARMAVLAAFMPAIMATGGNVGLQSTAMVVRSLAMGKLKRKHTLRVILMELKLGLLLGLSCGVLAAGVAYAINWKETEVLKLSLAVFLAMLSATLSTSLVGTAGPIVLHRLKLDPAIATGPFVTLFNDMFGCLVYLGIANLLFSL